MKVTEIAAQAAFFAALVSGKRIPEAHNAAVVAGKNALNKKSPAKK